MNFWNDRELALQFKNNQVPSKERFWYLLIYTVLITLGSLDFSQEKNIINYWDYANNISCIIITIVGILICYNTNKSGDDKEFIERFTCIGIPVMVRMILLCIPLALLMAIFTNTKLKGGDIFTLIYFVISGSFFYWRLNSAIKIASH